MVRCDLVMVLQVGENECARFVEVPIDRLPPLGSNVWTIQHECECQTPVGGAQRHIHCTCPIDSDAGRVSFDEISALVRQFGRKFCLAGQNISLPKCEEMLTTAEFPGIFDVGV